MNLYNIFPTTVGAFEFDRAFTEKELKLINGLEQKSNEGNTTSLDHYIFKQKGLKNLKEFVDNCINEYFDKIYCPINRVNLYVTQSWVNYTKKGQYHHKHAHPNSFISGVFYVNADLTKDKIYFYKEGYNQLELPAKEWNLTNSKSWWFEVGTGKLLLFPSSLTHMVHTVETEETRISISFNTFLNGYVGDEHSLTGLRLGE